MSDSSNTHPAALYRANPYMRDAINDLTNRYGSHVKGMALHHTHADRLGLPRNTLVFTYADDTPLALITPDGHTTYANQTS
jgi:Cu/Ag efflux protein CusF